MPVQVDRVPRQPRARRHCRCLGPDIEVGIAIGPVDRAAGAGFQGTRRELKPRRLRIARSTDLEVRGQRAEPGHARERLQRPTRRFIEFERDLEVRFIEAPGEFIAPRPVDAQRVQLGVDLIKSRQVHSSIHSKHCSGSRERCTDLKARQHERGHIDVAQVAGRIAARGVRGDRRAPEHHLRG